MIMHLTNLSWWTAVGSGPKFINEDHNSTVSQLKESIRLFKPELMFVSETKRKKGFVGTVCKKLGWGDRWFVVDPIGRSGRLLLGWNDEVLVYQIRSSAFSLEVELETSETNGKMWTILVYASNKERVRAEQWEELWTKRAMGR